METELVGLGGIGGAAGVAAIIALLRGALPIPDRFTGLLAVAAGVIINIAVRLSADAGDVIEGVAEPAWAATILTGVIAGLSATGLWEMGKAIRNNAPPA